MKFCVKQKDLESLQEDEKAYHYYPAKEAREKASIV